MPRLERFALSCVMLAALAACGDGDSESGAAGPGGAETPRETSSRIPLATGSGMGKLPEPQGPFIDITEFGASPDAPALENQEAINNAIVAAAAAGGGTVVVPAGDFKTYTIRLRSNVGIHLRDENSILRAAIAGTGADQEGGFYDAPEVNLFVGLQDHGHSHWANSLIYGSDVENVMISGPGRIDGSRIDPVTGHLVNVLTGDDPPEVTLRTAAGTPGSANKAIALKNAKHIIFRDFSIKNGGHFAILGTGIVGWTVDGVTIDTNRDAINVDASQDVTVRRSVFNSLTDDAIVLKASFGLGRYFATKNVLIEDCTVSGYDAGSVLAGTYTTNKLVATDRDGPTARIKLGTEGTTGFDRITIRNVHFERSRGFAIESVDGAKLSNIVMTDVSMKNVSSSPIFIRLGDRGRAPVTGNSGDLSTSPPNTVRLDNTNWVLPNDTSLFGNYPPVRFVPSYAKDNPVAIGGASNPFDIVSPTTPLRINRNSPEPDDATSANAVGVGFARVRNIRIARVTVEDADPRYPILLAGLVGHPIENVSFEDIEVVYRGGLKMEHAVEQRQIDQSYAYTPFEGAPTTQSIPWLVNTFFSKNEALLPRISWSSEANDGAGGWRDDPYNVPEMPREYPEPSDFGVLPAYGMYARHVRGLKVNNVRFSFMVEDERPAVVLDDVVDARFRDFEATVAEGTPVFVRVTNTRKRAAVREYVPDEPYRTTRVSKTVLPRGIAVADVIVDRPAPGTPPDTLYSQPTAPSPAAPFAYAVADASYPRPATVYRPAIVGLPVPRVVAGQPVTFTVEAVNPIAGTPLTFSSGELPEGAVFDAVSREFSWIPQATQVGQHTIELVVTDGLLPEKREFTITVEPQ